MTRRVSKRGIAYSEGSHKELGAFPKTCHGCGQRVRITRDYCWQETLEPSGEKRMWHFACRLEQIRAAA